MTQLFTIKSTFVHLKFLLLSIVIMLNFFANVSWAASEEKSAESRIPLPASLLNTDVEDREDVIELLASKSLYKEFRSQAQQIDALNLKDLRFAYELGLRSMLGQKDALLELIETNAYPLNEYHYSVHAEACINQQSNCQYKLDKLVKQSMNRASDVVLHKMSHSLGWSLSRGQDYLLWLFQEFKKEKTVSPRQALALLANFQLYKVYEQVLPKALPVLEQERAKRFEIKSDVLVKTPDGATLSAIVVRKRGDKQKRPAAFQFSIYADEKWNTIEAMYAASRGYVGVIGYTRGKAKSPDEIVPWEHDGKDANALIDWISKQSWSDGRVAMYGGSYLGFTQWAAAKYMHPALKTIVPYAAAHPFTGLPVENNIFITANYQWAFHVTNNKAMDHSVYEDPNYWQNVYTELFESGRAFKDIDKIEGKPNPWFQKMLKHPSYDQFYQDMLPFEQDYAKIDIPVLSITGYFDGGAISAIDFMKRHYQFNPKANHYLLTGPYTHGTAQGIPSSHFGKYKLDPVALEKDTKKITFEWFDHVLFGKAKPELIKDKVNYQLLGSNRWQHKPSYQQLNDTNISFYPTKSKAGELQLSTSKPNDEDSVSLQVDLSDRKTQLNSYVWPFLLNEIDEPTGLSFTTAPFEKATELAGEITGHFSIAINKKDVDIGFKLYEVTEDNRVFLLTRYISRASYANDMSKRALLTPHQKTQVPIINSRMMGKLIEKGSQLVLKLNVNKNAGAQVNLGTGKDVSDETIADAGEPLIVKWYSDSKINLPLKTQ